MDDLIEFKFWYGGKFSSDDDDMCYIGGLDRTFQVNLDDVCYEYLMSLAAQCIESKYIEGLYYLKPGLSLKDGLRKVVGDAGNFHLRKAAVESPLVNVYIVQTLPTSCLSLVLAKPRDKQDSVFPKSPSTSRPPKLPFVRGPQSGSGGKFDGQQRSISLDSSINASQQQQPTETLDKGKRPQKEPAVEEVESEEESEEELLHNNEVDLDSDDDEDYVVSSSEESEEELLNTNEVLAESSDDEEYVIARERVRGTCSKLLQTAVEVQKQAASGCLGSQTETAPSLNEVVDDGGHVSDYANSDEEMDTPPESDDDEGVELRRKRRALTVGVKTDFKEFKWVAGQRFTSKSSFKDALAKYAILQGRNVSISSSDSKRGHRTIVKCVEGCPFYLYASWDSRRAVFVVKSVEGEHSCARNMKRNKQLKATWVAKQFLDVFKSRPHWPAKEIMDTIKRAYGVLVSRGFAYKVKYTAHKMLHGSMTEHYNKLGVYVTVLKQVSPGSMIELVTDSSRDDATVFKRLHICFDGLKQGWLEGCRKVICIDACFLKTFLGGQLMVAIGRDNNDQMFPISWAVVEGENNESWEWFLRGLQTYLELGNGEGIVIISDEHKSIISGVALVLPEAEHRHCARHIYANWHKHFKGDELKQAFWRAAKAWNMSDYEQALADMAEIDEQAVDSFKSYNPKCFCRAFMKADTKVDVIVNNMAETFNGYIINARTKHILYMLEDIRTAVMQRLYTKRGEAEKWKYEFGPRVLARLEKEKENAKYCDAIPSTSTVFQCSAFDDVLSVDVEKRTCSCRKWDLTGIPCRHAIACISFLHHTVEDYLDPIYHKSHYGKAYSCSIPPIEGSRFWPRIESSLIPPPIKVGPGRPRMNRRKDPHESPKRPGKLSRHGIEMTCGLCNEKGHNKRKCPNKERMAATPVPTETAKRKRGRPRKNPLPTETEVGQSSQSTPTVQTPSAVSGSSQAVSPCLGVSFSRRPRTLGLQRSLHASAQPSKTGRNGRAIYSGVGSRGGRVGRSSSSREKSININDTMSSQVTQE